MAKKRCDIGLLFKITNWEQNLPDKKGAIMVESAIWKLGAKFVESGVKLGTIQATGTILVFTQRQ